MTALQTGRAPASEARRWWALVAIAASVLVVGLDLTILNLALPVLSVQLHASTTDLQWFSASYSLVLAAGLLPAGLLGDRLGRKKMLLIALVAFGASSAACAFAGSPAELIAARAVLGLGAAVIIPMSIAVLPVLFAPEERARAIAVIMGATFIAFPVGPLLGGWLLDNFWWGSVFLINVPVVVLALVAVALLMPESHGARSRQIDILGIILSSLGLAGVTYGCIRAGASGWGDPAALGAPGRPARDGPGPAGTVSLGQLHLGHDPDHVRLVRDVRHPVRDAAVLPGGPGPGLTRHRAADAADDRRDGARHGQRYPAAVPAERPGRPPRTPLSPEESTGPLPARGVDDLRRRAVEEELPEVEHVEDHLHEPAGVAVSTKVRLPSGEAAERR